MGLTAVLVLRGVAVLDGSGAPVLPDAEIVVQNGIVTSLYGPAPPGAHVIDFPPGCTALPGVVDVHVHLALAARPSDLVERGVTAVRDLGWPPGPFGRVADRARRAGLTVTSVGPMLTTPGGYPTRAAWAPAGTGLEVAGAAEARRAVDGVIDAGGCAVKVAMDPRVGPMLPREVLEALVDQAHQRGRRVVAHVGSPPALETCVEAAVDELAHAPFGIDPIPKELAARMVAAGMTMIPTLGIRAGDELAAGIESTRNFVQAGGTIAYGTDLGNAGTSPGIDGRECELLLQAGLSSAQVVVAATSTAAKVAGLDASCGLLATGRRADLLVVRGDPATDVTALQRIELVLVGGRVAAGPATPA